MATSAQKTKVLLRKKLRSKLEKLRGRDAKSLRICEAIAAHESWQKAKTIAIFAPLKIEPDVELLWKHGKGKVICYPFIKVNGLGFVRVNELKELIPGPWGLRQPVAAPGKIVSVRQFDLILIPGYGFCADGRRLGRGGGFYDRLLATSGLHAVTLGVAFHCQLLSDLPMELHDRKVDGVLTEKGFVRNP